MASVPLMSAQEYEAQMSVSTTMPIVSGARRRIITADAAFSIITKWLPPSLPADAMNVG